MNPLIETMNRHAQGEITETCVPRLALHRWDATTGVTPGAYQPAFCVVVQGCKRVFVGDESFHYNPFTYLVAATSFPVTAQVIEAPYLAFSLLLEAETVAEVARSMPTQPSVLDRAYGVSALEGDLLDTALRFIRLLDKPRDVAVLAPLIERELLYRLLLGPRGDMLRQLSQPSSQLSQINRAVAVIREQYDQPLRIEELARLAHMSEATFHRHFKAATSMSPLQFQKQIRLQEARRLLLSQDTDAALVGYQVGYESPSQFSREYRRLFGAPPVRDARRTLGALTARVA